MVGDEKFEYASNALHEYLSHVRFAGRKFSYKMRACKRDKFFKQKNVHCAQTCMSGLRCLEKGLVFFTANSTARLGIVGLSLVSSAQ